MTDQQLLNANIISALKLESLDDSQKFEIINTTAGLIQKRVALRVLESMSSNDKAAFDRLLVEKGNDAAEIGDFLRTHVKDLDDIFKQEIIKVKKELMEKTEQATESL